MQANPNIGRLNAELKPGLVAGEALMTIEVEEAPSKQAFLRLNDPNDNLSAAQQNALYAKVYPVGYQLSQEAGSETGDLRRVCEFAIIDRTVPVAFEPGQNHNVDKAVRLRRRID